MRTLRDRDGASSLTALAVAAGRAIGYRHLHDPLAMDLLPRAEAAVARRARRLAARPGGADAVAVATGGVSRHAALRMSAVDAAVTDGIAAGCGRVVVVGAGYDTRAWRLPACADVAVIEVDLPGTQKAKRARVPDTRPADDPVRFVAADLAGTSLTEALAGVLTEVDGGRTDGQAPVPTMWVWEAVAPYLPPAAVTTTLAAMAEMSAAGSRLAMTFAHPDMAGVRALRPAVGALASIGFRILGEPLLSTHDEWEISDALGSVGFVDPQITTAGAWASDAGLSRRPDPLDAEQLVVAVRR